MRVRSLGKMSSRFSLELPHEPEFQGRRPITPRLPIDFLQLNHPNETVISHGPPRGNNIPPSLDNNKFKPYRFLHQEDYPVTPADRYALDGSRAQLLNPSTYKNSMEPGREEAYKERFDPRVMENSSALTNGNLGQSSQEALRDTSSYAFESHSELSHTSQTSLAAAAMITENLAPQSRRTISQSPQSLNHELYIDTPYRYSRNIDLSLCDFDPRSIEDDGDDGLGYKQHFHRSSMLSFGNSERNSSHASATSGTSKGSLFGTLAAVVGKKPLISTNDPQYYDKNNYTKTKNNGTKGMDKVDGANSSQNFNESNENEKSEWLSKQSNGRSKLRLLVLLIVTIVVLGGITGGIVNSILHKKSSSSSSESAADEHEISGDLDKNSNEIKKLLNNPKLHKVFPAIDYTPGRAQYPDCLHDPPSQNDVTKDLAVLSQLSNTIRLYGTDCNQIEMLLHSINRLDLKGKAKIWMGVWLNGNETTNTRQLAQMYRILDEYGTDSFVGIIVGNEVLYRQDMTATELGDRLVNIKSNLTTRGISLPVASSDLGDDWTAQLASKTDILMANIHPFFAGVAADVAASWTWNFWQQHNVVLQPDLTKNIISETGWPSSGGTSCGGAATCITGSVASVDAMNKFMNDWVCQALANGTNYFWFEAFDEPWKKNLNTPGKEWEDKWGLLDAHRNLKPGVIIPSCGGKTVS